MTIINCSERMKKRSSNSIKTPKGTPTTLYTIKKSLILVSMLMLCFSCTAVRYNASPITVKKLDYPEIGKTITAYVGDHLVRKGTLRNVAVLVVHSPINSFAYNISAMEYPQIGYDEKQDFFAPIGVIKNPLADPARALSLERSSFAKLCVVSIFGMKACYEGHYEKKSVPSIHSNSFQQTLIYSGRMGDKINISYREFSNDRARPAFNNDVEYDLSTSNIIGYKGAQLEIIKADNTSITYKLLNNFPDIQGF